MSQARVLTDHEQKRILAVIAQTKHAARNRMAFILSYQAGMRVGEIAALTIGDVFEADSKTVKSQIRLSSEITKGGHARVVFVSDRLRREIERYRATLGDSVKSKRPLLQTQKRTAFSANTLCQLMGDLYDQAGLDGATSHSGRRWFITKLAHSGIGRCRCLLLAGAGSTGGVVGGTRAGGDAATAICRSRGPGRRRGSGDAAGNDSGGTGGRGLCQPVAVVEVSPAGLAARGFERSRSGAGPPTGPGSLGASPECCRAGAGASAAGHRQGGDLPDPGRRDRCRQSDRFANHL